MNDEIKRDRSPNYPKMPLAKAVEIVGTLHNKAGKSQIQQQVAASALGYGGLNGAALTTIGALTGYGLLDRLKGGGISVSPLALKLIHPVNEAQSLAARREAALKPRVYAELFAGGFQHCSEDVLANHLIQQDFTQDGARKAASVFKANVDFAKLTEDTSQLASRDDLTHSAEESTSREMDGQEALRHLTSGTTIGLSKAVEELRRNQEKQELNNKNVLAKYSIPLGANEATLVFTGENLATEDFDALVEYVQLFKKQFERKLKARAVERPQQASETDGDPVIGDP